MNLPLGLSVRHSFVSTSVPRGVVTHRGDRKADGQCREFYKYRERPSFGVLQSPWCRAGGMCVLMQVKGGEIDSLDVGSCFFELIQGRLEGMAFLLSSRSAVVPIRPPFSLLL